MEILAIIIAFWLMLVGVYGGLSLVASSKRRRERRQSGAGLRSAAVNARTRVPIDQPALGGLFSEVDMLRVQVETLREEVVALSGASGATERARLRRYRAGVYSELPRHLRRQVREVRNIRHPLGV